MLVFAYVALLLGSNCKDEKSIYEDCCGTSPTMDSIVTTGFHIIRQESVEIMARVLVPNIFVPAPPNMDGNMFLPFGAQMNSYIMGGGAWVNEIRHLVCLDNNGDTLFVRRNFLPNRPELGWDGKKPDGTLFYGSFEYDIAVEFFNGTQPEVRTYKNRACAFKCHDASFPTQVLPDCLFPNQNAGEGWPDKTQPYPKDCF